MASQIFMIMFLVFLEGILSLDNALALGALVRHLPSWRRQKALTYGVWGAFAFRVAALFCLQFVISNMWVRILGGSYLIFLALKYFAFAEEEGQELASPKDTAMRFWSIVLAVELTDVAFSLDSIIASVSLQQTLFITIFGGVIGIFMMRIAASIFAGLIDTFPRLEDAAYLLIFISGLRLMLEAAVGLEIPELLFQISFGAAIVFGLSRKRVTAK